MSGHGQSDFDIKKHTNFGILTLRMPPDRPLAASAPVTVIVTGVDAVCTAATAAVVAALGIPMSRAANDALLEDKEFTACLRYCDVQLMRALIDRRNMEVSRWGFQFPSLQNHLLPLQLKVFRNPHLIIATRDPAVIVSNAASLHSERDGAAALLDASQQYHEMVVFMQKVNYPTIVLPFDKLAANREYVMDCVTAFCGLEVEPAARIKALDAIANGN